MLMPSHVCTRAQMTHAIGVALALALVCCTFSVHAGQPHQIVTTGLEVLANNGYSALKGHRVGIVSNPSGIFPNLEHEVNVMAATPGVNLVAIYGPEHGFRGDQQAGSSDAFYIGEIRAQILHGTSVNRV